MSHRYEFIANWHWPAWEVQSYVGEMTQSPAPRTLYDKLLDANTVRRLAGSDQILLYIDRTVLNEYTSPQAFTGLREAGRQAGGPRRRWPWWTM